MIDKTCRTCIDNEDGFCDRKGILVDDEDSCENIEKTGVTDYWIIFSEVTERGDNVGYFIIGTLCFISGLAMGVFLTALIVAGADDNIGEVNELGDDENEL